MYMLNKMCYYSIVNEHATNQMNKKKMNSYTNENILQLPIIMLINPNIKHRIDTVVSSEDKISQTGIRCDYLH